MHYHLSLELVAPDASQLPGQAEITFQLQSTQDPLVLDFRDGSATNLTINGADDDDGANGHLIIPGHNFTTGRNRIALDFVSGIATSGRAITRYLDRDQYIYSLFVPMDASRAFPCFDQPDLKARFDLDITAPDNWTVVSNTRIESTAPAKPGFQFRRNRSPPHLPVRLGCRTLSRHTRRRLSPLRAPVEIRPPPQEAPEVLRIARAGVRHMAEYFHFSAAWNMPAPPSCAKNPSCSDPSPPPATRSSAPPCCCTKPGCVMFQSQPEPAVTSMLVEPPAAGKAKL